MLDAKRVLDQLVGSGAAGGFAGGLAGGALAGMLTGKKGRKMMGSALKVGGLALVGGLAYKAWQDHRRASDAIPGPVAPGPGEPAGVPAAFLPEPGDRAGTQALSVLLARSMISAAKADGQIDTRESQAILTRINELDVPAEDKAFLFEEYGRPLDIEGLAAQADSPEHAAEMYAASVLTVAPPSPAERIYLDTLARALGLEAGLARKIHEAVEAQARG